MYIHQRHWPVIFFLCVFIVWFCNQGNDGFVKWVREAFPPFQFFFEIVWEVHVCVLSCFSHVRLFAVLWTVACQAPLSMGFSREEYWSGFPCPPPGDLPSPWISPASHNSPVLAGSFFTTIASWGAPEFEKDIY